MKKNRVLVLGNSPHINQIDFNLIQSDIITLGINRIWLKHIPNYFFFHDLVIYNELSTKPEVLAKIIQNSTVFSSDWIRKGKKTPVPNWIKVYTRNGGRSFPDSASTSIRIFSREFMKNQPCTFYLAGISLTWENPSHFWKELGFESKNGATLEWYDARFPRMLENFRQLKSAHYDIVSVTPNSALNKIFRYENIANLYTKQLA